MEEITLQEQKDILKQKVRKDLLMYGIVTGICAVTIIIGCITGELGSFSDMGVSKIEYIIGLILAPLFSGWVFVGIGVGFKFLKCSLGKRLATSSLLKIMLIGLFCFCFIHIIGMIVFLSRVIRNSVLLAKLKNEIPE